MKRILFGVVALVCTGFLATAGDAPPAAGQRIRERFVPDKAGEKGAWGTHLGQPPGAMVHIGVGDSFSVRDKDDRAVFTLSMPEGNDDRVVLIVKTKDSSQKLELKRDKAESVVVAGARYAILYPSVEVAATEKATTNRAFIVVTEMGEK